MIENPSPQPDPHDSCAQIMRAVRTSGLTWGTQETPFSMFLTIRKRFLKNAKISPYTARPPTHTLGVDKGNQQYEQLLTVNRESQLTIQNLESGMERLKNDLEGEVNNSEKLNIALSVSKSLVNSLNTKYAEAVEQVNRSAKTFVNLDKASKALKKAKEEVGRLTNKNEESQKTIIKLRETLRFSFPEKEHNKLLQEKYHLENKLQEADQKASLAEDEVFMLKEQNTKMSVRERELMVALNNSKASQDALSRQLSEAVALGKFEGKNVESATSSFPNA